MFKSTFRYICFFLYCEKYPEPYKYRARLKKIKYFDFFIES